MYAIYGNIYHQYTPNVSIYTSTMDPIWSYGWCTMIQSGEKKYWLHLIAWSSIPISKKYASGFSVQISCCDCRAAPQLAADFGTTCVTIDPSNLWCRFRAGSCWPKITNQPVSLRFAWSASCFSTATAASASHVFELLKKSSPYTSHVSM